MDKCHHQLSIDSLMIENNKIIQKDLIAAKVHRKTLILKNNIIKIIKAIIISNKVLIILNINKI